MTPDVKQAIWYSTQEVDDFKERSRIVCKLFRKFERPMLDFERSRTLRNLCQKQKIDLQDLSTARGFESRLDMQRSQKRRDDLKRVVDHQREPGTAAVDLSVLSLQISGKASIEAFQLGLQDEKEMLSIWTQPQGQQYPLDIQKRKREFEEQCTTSSIWRECSNLSSSAFLNFYFEESPTGVWQRRRIDNNYSVKNDTESDPATQNDSPRAVTAESA